jgi:hypothetical protein
MKDIKDYLHLYLGQRCLVTLADDDPDGYYDVIDGGTIQAYIDDCEQRSIQPLLRLLSDMTEDDGGKIFGSKTKYLFYKKERDANPHDLYLFTPKEFAALLREGYDLFNLIPEGLAIHKIKETVKP